MTEEKIAEIIFHPGHTEYQIHCTVCNKVGLFVGYTYFEESLAKALFYCNDCKCFQKDQFNIDITNCPELKDKNAIPLRQIKWAFNEE